MRASSLKALCAALEQRQVRFIIAGGLAVNAHGYLYGVIDIRELESTRKPSGGVL
jgi:hypothetical protein